MKNSFFKFSLLILSVFSFTVLSACSKDETPEPVPVKQTIVDVAVANPSFTILVEALQKAGLVATLNSAGPFTVFAPTNDAFNALFTQLGVSGIKDLSAEALKPILLNHVLTAKVMSSQVSTGYAATANTGGPSGTAVKVYIQKGSGVMVDGAKVTQADVSADNGVIHVIDKVILPASVVNHALNNADFSILVQAVVKAGLVDALSQPGPFTVFAPTNAAFTKLFASLGVSGISDLSAADLTPILLYHVVSRNVTASQVTSGQVPTLKEGSNLNVVAGTSGVKINGSSNVIATDVQGVNGVIHVIDAVLLP